MVNIIPKKYLEGGSSTCAPAAYTGGAKRQREKRLQLTGGNRFGDLDQPGACNFATRDPIYLPARLHRQHRRQLNPAFRCSRIAIIPTASPASTTILATGLRCVLATLRRHRHPDFRPAAEQRRQARTFAFISILNEEQGTGLPEAGTVLSDNADLYATLLVSRNKGDGGYRLALPDPQLQRHGTGGCIWNSAEQTTETFKASFAPEEQGRDGGFGFQLHVPQRRALASRARWATATGATMPITAAPASRSPPTSGGRWWMDGPVLPEPVPGPATGHLLRLSGVRTEQGGVHQPITPDQFRGFSDIIHNVSGPGRRTSMRNWSTPTCSSCRRSGGHGGGGAGQQPVLGQPVDPGERHRFLRHQRHQRPRASARTGPRASGSCRCSASSMPTCRRVTTVTAMSAAAAMPSPPTSSAWNSGRSTPCCRGNYGTAFPCAGHGLHLHPARTGSSPPRPTSTGARSIPPTARRARYTGLSIEGLPDRQSEPDLDQREVVRLRFRCGRRAGSSTCIADYYKRLPERQGWCRNPPPGSCSRRNECRQGPAGSRFADLDDALAAVTRQSGQRGGPLARPSTRSR